MTSNSKLTQDQKAFRKEMIENLPTGSSFAVSDCGVTVLCVPDGKHTIVATGIMSADERKFRRKVGEFYALMRYNNGEVIRVPRDNVQDAKQFVLALFDGIMMGEYGYTLVRYI